MDKLVSMLMTQYNLPKDQAEAMALDINNRAKAAAGGTDTASPDDAILTRQANNPNSADHYDMLRKQMDRYTEVGKKLAAGESVYDADAAWHDQVTQRAKEYDTGVNIGKAQVRPLPGVNIGEAQVGPPNRADYGADRELGRMQAMRDDANTYKAGAAADREMGRMQAMQDSANTYRPAPHINYSDIKQGEPHVNYNDIPRNNPTFEYIGPPDKVWPAAKPPLQGPMTAQQTQQDEINQLEQRLAAVRAGYGYGTSNPGMRPGR